MKKKNSISKKFNAFCHWVTKVTGQPITFLLAILIVLVWAVTGPVFGFSETWQLVINTGTTIVTFLMMFVIQQSQNKDTMALHLKLNELIASNSNTSNRLIASEDLTDEELEVIKKYYKRISDGAVQKHTLFDTHSLDEADEDIAEKPSKMETKKHSKLKPKKQ